MEQVILAFEKEKTRKRVREVIESAGIAECLLCCSAAEVKRLVSQRHITTIVCGYKLADETVATLCEDLPVDCAILVVAVQGLLDMLERDTIFKLAAPVRANDLLASVRMLLQVGHKMGRFVRSSRSTEERGIIDQAKQILMDRYGMGEAQAHRFLQKQSMDAGVKLIQTAQMILEDG